MDAASVQAAGKLLGVFSGMDLIVIALALVGMGIGFYTGFAWQFVRIAGLVASLWVSWAYHPVMAQALPEGIGEPARLIGGTFIVFVGSLLVCYLVAYLFRDIINALKPEMPDRLLGAAFGLLKVGLLIGVASFLAIRYLNPEHPVRTRVQSSRGAVAAATCVRAFLYVLPDELAEKAEDDSVRPTDEAARAATRIAQRCPADNAGPSRQVAAAP